MNWHFKRLFSGSTSKCRTILRFFNILALQQRNLDMQDRFIHRYSLPLKVIPPWMEKGLLNTYAKDLLLSRICSRLVDVRDDMIPYCLKSSWKWFFRHLLQPFFIVFLYHFLPVLYTVVNYPNTWFTRSFLAQSAHKSNKFYNKVQNIWFSLSTYSVLQLPKQGLRKNVVLLNFCLCVYMIFQNVVDSIPLRV